MAASRPPQKLTFQEQQGKWWCNFCNLRTEDQDYYLSQSCQEELKKRGVEAAKEKSDHYS